MKIAIISGANSFGGAEIAAMRLACGLSQFGNEVNYIASNENLKSFADGVKVIKINNSINNANKNFHFLSEIYPLSFYLSTKLTQNKLRDILDEIKPDIINFHNVFNARWDVKIISLCASIAPIVWTLHDMSSFTGRCAYTYECKRHLTGCDKACPKLHVPFIRPKYYTEKSWRKRKKLIDNHKKLVAVTPSVWMKNEAKEGIWKNNRVESIANGISLDEYYPVPKLFAREKTGIESDIPVLLMAAANLKEKRKGSEILSAALEKISEDFLLAIMGNGNFPLNPDIPQIHLGYVPEELKPYIYSACDLYIHPSLADNLPNIIMESLACDTPCIGFKVGGVPEMIKPGMTGWIADEVSAEGLAQTIERALHELDFSTLSCRVFAEEHYELKKQAGKYMGLFEDLM